MKWSLSRDHHNSSVLDLFYFIFLILKIVWTEFVWVYVPSVFLNVGDLSAKLFFLFDRLWENRKCQSLIDIYANGQQFRSGASEQEFGTGDLQLNEVV